MEYDSYFSFLEVLLDIVEPFDTMNPSELEYPFASAFDFENKILTSVEIPNTVTSIGYNAFYGCSRLTTVNIPNSVTEIGEYAFYECSSLSSITIPNSVETIGERAFSHCSSLSSVTIPESVKHLEGAFESCDNLTSVSILCPITSISGFAGCYNLTSINIPASVTEICNYAFFGCRSLTSITIPNSVTVIGEHAFTNCTGIKSVNIPYSVTEIGEYAFARELGWSQEPQDSLEVVTIPMSVTKIGAHAFDKCSKVTIYCEAEREPDGWDDDWIVNYENVIWGCDLGEFEFYSAIAESAVASAVNIYAIGNKIVVENATGEIAVYDVMGRLVYRSNKGNMHIDSSTETFITINHTGVYIVKVGNFTKRVFLN